jgi:hypothetical protein
MIKFSAYIFLFFFLTAFCQAQQTLVFEDNYGIQGEFVYRGELSDSLSLINGGFNLKWREIEEDTLTTFKVNGNMKTSMPDGSWIWEQAGWDYKIEPGRTIHPTFNFSGLYEVWRGDFSEGLPNGTWTYMYGPPNMNRSSQRVPIRIETNYDKGLLVDNFKIVDQTKSTPILISGSCSKSGIAEGKWKFEYTLNDTPIIEERTYEEGILTHLIITSNNPLYSLEKRFERNNDFLKQLKDAQSTTIRIGEKDFVSDEFTTTASELLSYYFNQHIHRAWQLKAFPIVQNGKNPIFKRFCFPLSKRELTLRDEITLQAREMRSNIDEVLHLGNILINRKRSVELDLSIAYLEKSLEQLTIIDSLIAFSHLEDFIYFDRVNGELKAALQEVNTKALAYPVNYDSEPITLPRIQVKRDIYDFFQLVHDFLNEVNTDISIHFQILKQNHIAIRQESEIKMLETQLENDWLLLDSLYSNLAGTGEHIYTYWIRFYLSNKIKEYAQIEEYDRAMKNGNLLLNKMDSLVAWNNTIKSIDSIVVTIDDYYKQMAYNPYTGKYDISLPLKRRFATILKTSIIPHISEDLLIHEKWDDFQVRYLRFVAFNEDIKRFALLNEKRDTRLEKRLRKESNPEKFIRLFLDYMESR